MRIEQVWLIGALAFGVPFVVCGLGWWRASRRLRRLEEQIVNPPSRDEAIQRLEQVVEGLTSQLDDLANGQDFLQRVLTNKAPSRSQPLAEPPKIATPV